MPEQCPAAWRLPQIGAQALAPPAAGCSGSAPCNGGTAPGPRGAICLALEKYFKKTVLQIHDIFGTDLDLCLTYRHVGWQTALFAVADKSSNNLLSNTHLLPCGLADGTPRTCRQKFQ